MPITRTPFASTVTRHGRTSQYIADGFAETSTVHLDTATDSTLIAYMLVDISDTTNWKHTNTDHIIIRHILIEVVQTLAGLEK